MPNYDFSCRNCGKTFTKKLSFSERKTAACEYCGSRELEQLFKSCNILGVKGGSRSSGCSGTAGCSGCSGCH